MSTAKSYGLATVFLSLAKSFPGTRYGVFRRHGTVINRTIRQTIMEVSRSMGLKPKVHYDAKRSPDEVWEFANVSQIWLVGLDETKDPVFNDVKGMKPRAAGIDEANEVVEDAFTIVGPV